MWKKETKRMSKTAQTGLSGGLQSPSSSVRNKHQQWCNLCKTPGAWNNFFSPCSQIA